jgi:Uma2 family endonuclease
MKPVILSAKAVLFGSITMVTLPYKSRQSDDSLGLQPAYAGTSCRSDLPTMYDLPSESIGEPGLPDEFHDLQPQLLSRTLQLSGYQRSDYFTVSDLNIYYDLDHKQWYKRADWFLAVGVPYLYEGYDLRRSYVNWHEPRSPHVVIEFLSTGTEAEDLGRFHTKTKSTSKIEPIIEDEDTEEDTEGSDTSKREKPPSKLVVYEQYLQVPHYLVYSRQSQELRYFRLMAGKYQEQQLQTGNPLVWLEDLEIGLGIWEGMLNGIPGVWLRWCDRNGNWLLTDTEQAEQIAARERLAKLQAEQQTEQERLAKLQAEQQTEQERLAKEQSQNQLLQSARNLLATGMEMEQVIRLLNLSEEQIQWLNDHPV